MSISQFLVCVGVDGTVSPRLYTQRLGALDASALPTVRRYGAIVDVEHERFFTDETVPAVIDARGWTDDVVDFVFWVLAWNFYNSLQEHAAVWRKCGWWPSSTSCTSSSAILTRRRGDGTIRPALRR